MMGSSYRHEVFHTQKCSKDLMFTELIEDPCHFVSNDKDYRKSVLAIVIEEAGIPWSRLPIILTFAFLIIVPS